MATPIAEPVPRGLQQVLQAAFLRSLPLGLACGALIATSIMIGWQHVPSAVACFVIPAPILSLVLIPEVLARRRERTLRRDVQFGALTLGLAVFLNLFAFYNLGYAASGGQMGRGAVWLQEALTNPSPRFLALVFAISLSLGTLTFLRLRGHGLPAQMIVLLGLSVLLVCGLWAMGERRIRPSTGVRIVFVDLLHYTPLQILYCLLGPPLLEVGDKLYARFAPTDETSPP